MTDDTPDTARSSRDISAAQLERGKGGEGDEHGQCLRTAHERSAEGAGPAVPDRFG